MTKACFSQWFPSNFEVDDIAYNCAEQYMMAEKARLFGDEETRTKILANSDPKITKALGREGKTTCINVYMWTWVHIYNRKYLIV